MERTEHSCASYFLHNAVMDDIDHKLSHLAYALLFLISVASITLGSLYLTKVISASVMLPCTLIPALIPYLAYRMNGHTDIPKYFTLLLTGVLIYFIYNQALSPHMAAPLFFITALPMLNEYLQDGLESGASYQMLDPTPGLCVDGLKTVAFAALAYLLLFTKTLSLSIAAPSFLGLATLSLISTSYFNKHNPRYVFLMWLVNAAACALIFFNQLPPEFLTGMALGAASLSFGSFASHAWRYLRQSNPGMAYSNFV